jgi:hypothetical protein
MEMPLRGAAAAIYVIPHRRGGGPCGRGLCAQFNRNVCGSVRSTKTPFQLCRIVCGHVPHGPGGSRSANEITGAYVWGQGRVSVRNANPSELQPCSTQCCRILARALRTLARVSVAPSTSPKLMNRSTAAIYAFRAESYSAHNRFRSVHIRITRSKSMRLDARIGRTFN